MKGTKKFRFFKRCVALLMVAFMLIAVPVFQGGTAKAAGKDVVPDDNLRKELAAMGGINESQVTKEYLAGLSTIMVSYEVNDLTGIEYCTNVKYISISGGFGSKVDLSKLSGLKNLEMLFISGVKSDDYTPLASLTNLQRLDISYSDVKALPNMSNLTKLEIIDVASCTSLTDISGISGCNNLEIAYLERSAVTDITPLKGKTKLTYLDLEQIEITDENKTGYMSTISSLTNLETLYMGWCGVSDEHLSMFDGLSKIAQLQLWSNNISDPSFLTTHKNTLKYVNIGGNPITDGSELANLTGVRNFAVDATNITDFSFVSKMTSLDKSNYGFTFGWDNYGSICTYNRIDDNEATGAGVYRIKNKVKDHNGKYVAPVASDKYTYDSTTNEILIKLDEYGESYYGNVIFNIDLKSPSGDNLYASHRLEYQIYNAQPLKITSQPESQKVKPGEGVRFEVAAEGEGSLDYQWYKDGNAIPLAISRILNVYDVEQDDAGEYYVVVSDKYNNEITSDKVKLSLNVVPLVITTQPEDVTVDEGDEISFSVAATGDGTLTYQWYKDGNPIAGATANTYTNKNVDETDIGEYYVEVSDGYDTIESDKVQAKVNLNPLKITTQPKSVTVGEEKTAALSVVAVAGKGTLTYQWYKDGNPIAGATAATLEIADASASDAGKYRVIVKDARETIKSTEASVVVELIPLEITAQPVGAQLKEDAAASLKVTATGKGTLTYQWYKDGNPIAGATKDTLEIAAAGASDEGEYYVVVSDVRNTANSDEVSVTVELIPLEITAQPVSTTLGEGKDGSLSVTATGKGTLTYQWYKDGVAIDGATEATLEIPEASTADEGKYHIVVNDVRNTVESEKIDVKVALIPLEITGQPVGVEITEGGSTSLTVKATGKGTLTYQWYKGDKAIEGATKDTLSLEELKIEDSGEYYVVVKDERNQTASVKALVKVTEKTTEAPTTENTTEAPENKPPVDGPATGDGPMPVVFVMMLLAGMASVILAKLRKNNI